MSIHGLIDRASTTLGSRFMAKAFREGLETAPLQEHLDSLELSLPNIEEEGEYGVTASTLAGELDALFRIAQWRGSNYPTVIYHHGAAETPFDYGFKKIFPLKKIDIKANLILLRAPFHESLKDYKAGIVNLNNYLAMIATSISLIERLTAYIREESSDLIVISGTSLGGYITNFHHIFFDSASYYVPLLAGVNMYHTLFESIYAKGVVATSAADKEKLNELLNFTAEFAEQDNSNVYPLLAADDQIVRLDVQEKSYGDVPVQTFAKGHVTGALAGTAIRDHISASTGLDLI